MRAMRGAICLVAVLAARPAGVRAAPIAVAPPFDLADPVGQCTPFPAGVGTCEAESVADAATGHISMSATTTFTAIATTDNAFKVTHAVKKASRVRYSFTFHVDVLAWEDADGGEAILRVSARHLGCDCEADLFAFPFNAGQPPHQDEDLTLQIDLANPAGGKMPAGDVDVFATVIADTTGGDPVFPARFTAEVAWASVSAVLER